MIRHTLLVLVVAVGAAVGTEARAQNATSTVTESTRTWTDHAAFQDRLESLASAHRRTASLETIGTSLEGRKLHALRLAQPGDVDPDARPAILLVAGIDATRPHTSECAVDVAEHLLVRAEDGDEQVIAFLESNTLYVIPRVNPDGHEYNMKKDIKDEHSRNMRADDADRDRATDEDGPDDLNNDGMITMMRIYDPRKGNRMVDGEDSRLDTEPDRDEGERPAFYLLTEGIDNDGDGRHNEDARGGVDLDMNFMHGYKAHADGAGRHQLSEPESMAILQYALNHQNIAAVVVYGQHDNLSNPPSADGRNDAGAPRTIESGDEAMYERISGRFIELTELEHVDSNDWSGSFAGWAYGQYGVPAFSTPLWTMPKPQDTDDVDDTDGESADNTEGEQPAAGERQRGEGAPGRSGGFNQENFMEEFDTNKDGELDETEREALRETMRERFGGRGGPGGGEGRGGRGGPGRGRGAGGGRGGPGAGGQPDDAGGGRGGRGRRQAAGGGGEQLTPSQFGDISQETIDELMERARAQGMEIDESQMSQVTPEMIEMFAQRAGVEIRRVSSTGGDADGGGRRRGGGKATEADWLKYSDEQRNGEGFVEWTTIEHPDFDHVEVGGWAPGFRTVPPIEDIDGISRKQTEFILDLAGHLPDVQLQDIEVERLAKGLWIVRASLVNEGKLPAGTAMARRNRRARPWVVRLGTEPEQVINGQRVQKVWTIAPDGGRQDMRWVIEHPDGEPLEIELFSEKYGGGTHVIPMNTSNEGGGE